MLFTGLCCCMLWSSELYRLQTVTRQISWTEWIPWHKMLYFMTKINFNVSHTQKPQCFIKNNRKVSTLQNFKTKKLISCTLCNFPGVLSCFSGTELFASDKQKVSVQLHTLPNYIDSQIGTVWINLIAHIFLCIAKWLQRTLFFFLFSFF